MKVGRGRETDLGSWKMGVTSDWQKKVPRGWEGVLEGWKIGVSFGSGKLEKCDEEDVMLGFCVVWRL